MFVPEKLKLNKFVPVAVPRPRDYFIRFGGMLPTGNSFTGDSVAPMPMTKVESLSNVMHYDDYQRYAESQSKSVPQTEPQSEPSV